MLDLDWIAQATGAKSARKGQRIQSLWDGYGEILRVDLVGSSLPSVIVKWVKPPERGRGGKNNRGDLRKRRSYEVETTFYRNFATLCDDTSCRVARLIDNRASRSNPDERILILEDLDEAGFAERRRISGAEEISLCLSWLASFHARFLGVSPKGLVTHKARAPEGRAGLWPIGTYWHLDTRPDELAAMGADDEDLRQAAPLLDRMLRECEFQTIVHGDAKLANFCFGSRDDGDQAVAAVDFQYVGGGCGMKDVAYLICGEAENVEARYLDLYFDRLRDACKAHWPKLDSEKLEADWRELYPVACADFYRFLAGWSPGHWRRDAQAQRFTRALLARLKRA